MVISGEISLLVLLGTSSHWLVTICIGTYKLVYASFYLLVLVYLAICDSVKAN